MQWEPLAGGGLVAGLFGLLINGLRNKIEHLESCKVDTDVCNERHKGGDATLARHDQALEDLKNKIDVVVKTVTRIEAKIDNGYRNGR